MRGARVITLVGDSFPVDEERCVPLYSKPAEEEYEALIFLGHDGQRAWFARDAGRTAGEAWSGAALWDLRRAGLLLDAASAGLLAYAKALCHWQRHARYCGRCGAPTRVRDGGHLIVCSNPDCATQQFPRLDPAVIMRVTHDDRVLLGRQAGWPPGLYSVLAGFVEPGESLEDAVRREVTEEARLKLTRVRYHSSQPWPFPSSLMLGFTAEAASPEAVARDELEDVQWFDRDELARSVRRGRLRLPPPLSISHRLLADWYASEDDALAQLMETANANGAHGR